MRREFSSIGVNVALLLLAALVAYGRWQIAPFSAPLSATRCRNEAAGWTPPRRCGGDPPLKREGGDASAQQEGNGPLHHPRSGADGGRVTNPPAISSIAPNRPGSRRIEPPGPAALPTGRVGNPPLPRPGCTLKRVNNRTIGTPQSTDRCKRGYRAPRQEFLRALRGLP